MYYSYIGMLNGQYQYSVTLKLFMRCNSGRQFPDPAVISVFDKTSSARMLDISSAITNRQTIQIKDPDPCITNPPVVCYEVAFYNFTLTVPGSFLGYTLASEVNYRIRGISNLQPGALVGATYTCEIPGTSSSNGAQNNSAVFTGTDLVVVCAENYFSYSFAAEDKDGDELLYSFCGAYISTNDGVNGAPAGLPPYHVVPYGSGFSELAPLGDRVSINTSTGLITGIAPAQGVYVVTVCVREIRNGQVIATQRKDLQINIADCSVAGAMLDDDYMVCGTTRDLVVNNKSNSPLIKTYDWTVFNPAGINIYSSTNASLAYNFATNGIYTVQLIINRGQSCTDTGSAPVYVFPGLNPDFNATGICITRPTAFHDATTLITGAVNSWKWDFGEASAIDDISSIQHPVYTYPITGTKNASLIVTTTEGCRDTINKTVAIIDKPPITLSFNDTLICLNDRLQLQASGTGNFNWSPSINLLDASLSNPTVFPASTTMYYVDLEIDGCTNRDSVLVRVVDHVSLQVMNDTTICTGDTIQLRTVTDGLSFAWTPASQLNNASIPNPVAITPASTPYQVTATIGGCFATRNIIVTTVPYPFVDAGPPDTSICYNTSAPLRGHTNANSWIWQPASSLNNVRLLNPVAYPTRTTTYILTGRDSQSGCPKPSSDSIKVIVLPKIHASAGRDTAVIVGQPLQLHATGGDKYVWSPAANLSSINIPDPILLLKEASTGVRYQVNVYNAAGCSDSASINVKVFATGPTVFVPTAFTPNNDGLNDYLRPVAVGMQRIEYFNIYNRWGQLVYSSSINGLGWDGRISGQPQASNTYVWMVKAVDYLGKPYFLKGIVTLVR